MKKYFKNFNEKGRKLDISNLHKGEFACYPNQDLTNHEVIHHWNEDLITSFEINGETIIASIVEDEVSYDGKDHWFYVSLTDEESDIWNRLIVDEVYEIVEFIESLKNYDDRIIVETLDGKIV